MSPGVTHILALLAGLSAFGSHLQVLLVVAFYLGSAAAAAVVLTPGGPGSVQAILVASRVSVGGGAAAMLAAVLRVRALPFWLTIVRGVVATWMLRRRRAL